MTKNPRGGSAPWNPPPSPEPPANVSPATLAELGTEVERLAKEVDSVFKEYEIARAATTTIAERLNVARGHLAIAKKNLENAVARMGNPG